MSLSIQKKKYKKMGGGGGGVVGGGICERRVCVTCVCVCVCVRACVRACVFLVTVPTAVFQNREQNCIGCFSCADLGA